MYGLGFALSGLLASMKSRCNRPRFRACCCFPALVSCPFAMKTIRPHHTPRVSGFRVLLGLKGFRLGALQSLLQKKGPTGEGGRGGV